MKEPEVHGCLFAMPLNGVASIAEPLADFEFANWKKLKRPQ